MEEYLGISFTNRSIVLAHAQKNEDSVQLVSIQDILYPFQYELNFMMNPENVDSLADRIGDYLQKHDLVDNDCMITLPIYMAQLKRAALPTALDERIVHKHLQWEVENLSSRELSEYKVIRLDHSFMFGTYQEFVFLLIQKQILENIKRLGQKASLKIKKVLLDFDSVLNYLRHFQLIDGAKNQIVFQIDAFQVSTFIYLNGLFFDYSLHPLADDVENKDFETKVVEIIESELERIDAVLAQLPQGEGGRQIFSTRLLTRQMKKRFEEKHLPISELSVRSQLNDERFASDNIEAYGVIF